MNFPKTKAWTCPFIPERLTPLAFTPSWSGLTAEEQLRYNQLHGLYFHEQIIFFEQAMIVPMLLALRSSVSRSDLRDALGTFIEEENRHSAQFHALLCDLAPNLYLENRYHFVRTSETSRRLLAIMVNRPQIFPFFIWLVQLLEERTMYASRLYLADSHRFPSEIVALQRQHLVDEADHVQWDLALLAQFWDDASPFVRQINARLLDWILAEYVALPRRAAMRVIDELASACPEISVPPDQLKADLRTLANNPNFRRGVFGRDAVPRTWKEAARSPDLSRFVQTWLSHEQTA